MTTRMTRRRCIWVLRGVQRVLRFSLVASAIVTGFLVFFGPLVIAPAMILVFC